MKKIITTGDKAVQDIARHVSDPGYFRYPKGTKKPLFSVLKGGEWRGQRCFVIGGGPSLRGFDFNRLEGKGRIIACNKAFLDVPFADMMIAMDHDFYRWIFTGELAKAKDKRAAKKEIIRKFRQFKGFKVWIELGNNRMDGVYYIHKFRLPQITRNFKQGVYGGNNTGTAALMTAVVMGCNPIYLLGIDCKHQGRRTHYHSGYHQIQAEKTAHAFANHFKFVAKPLKRQGIRVINLNPRSGLRCFPFSTIDEVLNDKIRNDEGKVEGSGISEESKGGHEGGMGPATKAPEKGPEPDVGEHA